ncbi:hypothetical protein BJ138DRAFT_628132 [Hygrophoropsis aurantiaca]|uniref:Uncharacterized protein n=1 Tax=Hygrophoropsis aurantiaca TaxID=72124 RepID=A0ACB7ZZA6_9AGAM|nr:hypothetical protein BJ138DRAFT_628132 [Hygrophoropsis aurantiaca]
MASSTPTPERADELGANLASVNAQIDKAVSDFNLPRRPQLLAVSKEKPASDVRALYDAGHRDFGENRVDLMAEKASKLPSDIRWHFIGAQPKGKELAKIPNLYAVQTITSTKVANELNKALLAANELNNTASPARPPLNVYIQVNTSREAEKKGLEPLLLSGPASSTPTPPVSTVAPQDTPLAQLAIHIITKCPHLRLLGLMTIGSLAESVKAGAAAESNSGDAALNADFETLKETRTVLEGALHAAGVTSTGSGVLQTGQGVSPSVSPDGNGASSDGNGISSIPWGENGRLLLSMGMSTDYIAAVHAGSDVVRVGTAIFGARPPRVVKETPATTG